MEPSKHPLLLVAIAILLPFSSHLCTVDGQYDLCHDYQDGTFTSNDTYGKTLDALLGSITTATSDTLTYGLFNVSASRPQDPDDIQVLGVCSGDLTGDDCRDCLNGAAHQVRQLCPTKKRATMFEDKCWIRHSDGQLYGVLRMDSYIIGWNVQNASDGERFMVALLMLLGRLQSEAASGGSIRKYAAESSSFDLSTLYGMVQCSPDLSYNQCIDCVGEATWRSSRDKSGGSLLTHSCRSRFETYRFFNSVAVPLPPPPIPPPPLPPPLPPPPPPRPLPLPPPPPPPPPPTKTWIIVAASSGSAVIVVILVFLIVKRKKRNGPFSRFIFTSEVIDDDVGTAESLRFDLDIIRAATENFLEANKLGQGGFGSVFRVSGNEFYRSVSRFSVSTTGILHEHKHRKGYLFRIRQYLEDHRSQPLSKRCGHILDQCGFHYRAISEIDSYYMQDVHFHPCWENIL